MSKLIEPRDNEYDGLFDEVAQILETARHTAARAVNAVLTQTYWEIGRRIVANEELHTRQDRYGEILVEKLAKDLTKQFGRGFGRRNVFQMRAFYLAYRSKVQTLSAQSFPLSWSHYVRLLSVENRAAREFYETEALREGWSVRQLDRQISTLFYQRLANSRDKAAMLGKEAPGGKLTAMEAIKDPLVLEFLGLKDEYSESDLEEAMVKHLEAFLLELGRDFTFVARQKRLRVGDEWYRVDLVLFHRRLRALVIIDLKIGKFSHADAGQMNLYLNYARQHWTNEDENPPIGLILCADKDDAVAHYALGGMENEILAARYSENLPDEAQLAAELERVRRAFEARL